MFTQNQVQVVRLVDVFLLGPIMIYAGNRIGGPIGLSLAISGVATIGFNAVRYMEQAQN